MGTATHLRRCHIPELESAETAPKPQNTLKEVK